MYNTDFNSKVFSFQIPQTTKLWKHCNLYFKSISFIFEPIFSTHLW